MVMGLLVTGLCVLAPCCRPAPESAPAPAGKGHPVREALAGLPAKLAPGAAIETGYPLRVHEPAFPGDHEFTGVTWNELFEEPGESFEAYMYGYKRGTALRSIHIWPLGQGGKRMTQATTLLARFLSVAFTSEVQVEEPIDPLPGSINTHFAQYDANAVLNGLMRDERVDNVNHLNIAIADRDMYAGKLAYVFGYADYVHHVGVLSLARLGDRTDGQAFKRRLLKLARHEVAHMYGMAHCVDPSCVMRGANTQSEADSLPLHMCPSCAAKLAWRIGDDGRERNDALAAFYAEHFHDFLQARLLGPPTRTD